MNLSSPAPPLLSRILLAATALLVVGVAYWFLSRALEQEPGPPLPPVRHAQNFNPKADVSKNKVFPSLNLESATVPDLPIGRDNPFLPLTAPVQPGAATTVAPIPGSNFRISPVAPAVKPASSTSETGAVTP